MALTQKIWSPQHLFLRYGACNIYSWVMGTWYLLTIDGIHSKYSWEMESKVFVHKIYTQYLSLRVGDDNIFSSEVDYTAFFNDWCSPKHWLSRDGVHSFYCVEIGSTACTDWRWNTHYFLMSDRVHSILSRFMLSKTLNLKKWGPQFYWLEMEYTLLIHEMWRPQHWLSRHGFKSICS